MKVVVTGRNGQLARCLAERSRAWPGLEVELIGRPRLDLARQEGITGAIVDAAPNVVVNAAAYTAVDQAEKEPDEAFRINADAASMVATAAASAGARIIQLSTDYVFDGASATPYDEAAAPGPLSVYGRSKLEGEHRVRSANPDHVVVRTAWVYSPFGRNFVRAMMAAARERDTVSVVADQYGSPTSALDLADGLLTILDRWQVGSSAGLGQTFHLAGTGAASWFDLARQVFTECSRLGLSTAVVRPIRSSDWPTPAARPANVVLDCAKFEAAFGFRMPEWRRSVGEIVRRIGQADG